MSVPSTSEILNIIDNLEQKLNRHKTQYNPKEYPNIYTMYDPNSKAKTEKRNTYNIYRDIQTNDFTNQFQQQLLSSSNDNHIRKLIKEEFASLILPYQQDLHNNLNILETKINNNTSKIKDLNSKNLENLNNMISRAGMGTMFVSNNDNNTQQLKDNNQYVLRMEFENKISELEIQMTSLNTYTKSLKQTMDNNNMENSKKIVEDLKRLNDLNNNNNNIINQNYIEKDEYEEKISEIKKQFDNISEKINQNKNNINDFQNNLISIKNEISSYSNDINTIRNNINSFQNKMNLFQNDIKDLKQSMISMGQNADNNNKVSGLNEEMKAMRIDLNALNEDLKIVKNNPDFDMIKNIRPIINQCVNMREFNTFKNSATNDLEEMKTQNNNNIEEIKNTLQMLEDKINNINQVNNNNNNNNDNDNFGDNNNNNYYLDEKKNNLLMKLEKIDLNKLKQVNFDNLMELEKKIEEINNDINVLKNNNYNDTLSFLKPKINEHDTEINKIKNQLSEVKEEINKNIKRLEEQITKINNNANLPSNSNSQGYSSIKGSVLQSQIKNSDNNNYIKKYSNKTGSVLQSEIKNSDNSSYNNIKGSLLQSSTNNNNININKNEYDNNLEAIWEEQNQKNSSQNNNNFTNNRKD